MGITPASQATTTPPSGDQATNVLTGTFTGTSTSSYSTFYGPFNIVIYGNNPPNGGWSGTVRLERSFDGGTTWVVCGVGGAGQQAIWNTPNTDISVVAGEPERGVAYRLNCTAFTTGTITYRMSTTGQAAVAMAVTSVI